MPGGTRIPFTDGMRYDETAIAVRERVGELVIGRRFTGPPTTANGGYACGAIARFVDEPARVVLRVPPPVDTPLSVWAGTDVRHLLSDCFVCGPHRADGLGVTPGPVEGAGHVLTAAFVPDASVAADGIVDRASCGRRST